VDAPQHDLARRDLVAVLQRVVRVRGLGCGVNAHRNAVLQCEPPVAGKVIRMRVRLESPDYPHLPSRSFLEVLLYREGRVGDDSRSGSRIADEIRRATEGVIDELREDHGGRDRSSRARYFS
jgi:hypothetical protein